MFWRKTSIWGMKELRKGFSSLPGGLVSARTAIFLLPPLVFSILLSPLPPVSSANSLIIKGTVIDSLTGSPLKNATIAVYNDLTPFLISSSRTNSSGQFEFSLHITRIIRIYAYYDDPSTPGFDYLPAMKRLFPVTGTINVSFSLVPGATVEVKGEIMMVNYSEASEEYLFTVYNSETREVLRSGDYILRYGTIHPSESDFMSLDPQVLIVPASLPFNIHVSASFPHAQSFSFLIDEPGHFNLTQGQILKIDIRKYSIPSSMEVVNKFLWGLKERLDDLEWRGFYLVEEKRDLQTLLGYAEMAKSQYDEQVYDGCYASLRHAYIKASELEDRLDSLCIEAARSIWGLTFLLSLMSIALASFLTESGKGRSLISLLLYGSLLPILYFVYPGFRVIKGSVLVWAVLVPPTLILGVIFLLPLLYRQRITRPLMGLGSSLVVTFSLAKRNIGRRGLRSFLTIFTVMILSMSFVSITSIYAGYGVIVREIEAEFHRPALLVRQRPLPKITTYVGIYYPATIVVYPRFRAIESFIIEWFENRPEVGLIAPKLRNRPSYRSLGVMSSPETRRSLPLNGFLGILPSAESHVTNLNETVVEGRFLRDNDNDAVLISINAKEKLGLSLNDNLMIRIKELGEKKTRVFRVVGFFDDKALSRLRDLDGEALLPRKMVTRVTGNRVEYLSVPCDSDEIFITTLDIALSLGGLVSRVDVLLDSSQSVLPISRTLVLKYDCMVWGRVEDRLYKVFLGAFYESKGILLLIPFLLAMLNVVMAMLNSIYERRGEISILSAVGLNPMHISMIFVTECLIIGLLGGATGYLSGLGFYRLMIAANINLEVRQKVSILWSLGTFGLSLTTALVGAVVALKWSLVVTPSLTRRWRIEGSGFLIVKPWVIKMPIEVSEEDKESLLDYLEGILRVAKSPDWQIVGVKREEERVDGEVRKKVRFSILKPPDLSRNLLVTRRVKGEDKYEVELISEATIKMAYRTAKMLRNMILEWSTKKSGLKID